MNIVYIGSAASSLSVIPLQQLVACSNVVALLTEQSDVSSLPVTTPSTLPHIALQHQIPLLDIHQPEQTLQAQLEPLQPDLLICSCIGWRVPPALLQLPRLAAVNLHPSALPAFRGPEPLFWQYQQGVERFAITLHVMTDQFDAGDIVLQQEVIPYDGQTLLQSKQQMAEQAAKLLQQFLRQPRQYLLQATAQDATHASYQGWPQAADYRIDTRLQCRQIINFVKACGGHGVVFECKAGGQCFKVIDIIDRVEKDPSPVLPLPAGQAWIECADGWLRCRIIA